MLRITTPTREFAARMRRVASMPFILGIARSITTTSGASVSANRTLSRPSAASATTVMSLSRSSMARRPSRTTVWSSANKIRIGVMSIPLVQFGHRHQRVNQRPPPRLRANREASSQPADSLFHTQQAQAAQEARVETRSVIPHCHVHLLVLPSNCDFYGARVGVADRIVHSLLHQPVDARPVFVGQAVDGFVGGYYHVESSALAGFTRVPLQSRRQTEVVQHRWPKQQRQVSHLAHLLFR